MSYKRSRFTCQRENLTIRGYEYLPRIRDMEGRQFPAVIISHGFTGNHQETDPYGRYLAQKGYAAYTFDFCGGGPHSKSDGAMEHMTVNTEIADLKSVVSYVESQSYINPERITLMGCSQGGFVSGLTAGSIPEKIARLILFFPAISLADDARKGQLMLISGGSHGFMPDRKNHRKSLTAVDEFLKGYTEVLTIDVRLTDMIRETKGLHTHLELPFTGTAKSPWFSGEIQEGAQDTQELTGLHADSKCADYVIQGRDYTGASCRVHVINRGSGAGWKPIVTTDSKALSFLNDADCNALLEDRKCGPLVRIYAHVKPQA